MAESMDTLMESGEEGGRETPLSRELLDLWYSDANACGMYCGLPAPCSVLRPTGSV